MLFGNNAGQGLPLAQSPAPDLITEHAAIIYANSLPEKKSMSNWVTGLFSPPRGGVPPFGSVRQRNPPASALFHQYHPT